MFFNLIGYIGIDRYYYTICTSKNKERAKFVLSYYTNISVLI